jgi:hypothetical protein
MLTPDKIEQIIKDNLYSPEKIGAIKNDDANTCLGGNLVIQDIVRTQVRDISAKLLEAQIKELRGTTDEEMLKNITLELSNWGHYIGLEATGDIPEGGAGATSSEKEAGFILHEFVLPIFNAKLEALQKEIERQKSGQVKKDDKIRDYTIALKLLNDRLENYKTNQQQAVKEAVEKVIIKISSYPTYLNHEKTVAIIHIPVKELEALK